MCGVQIVPLGEQVSQLNIQGPTDHRLQHALRLGQSQPGAQKILCTAQPALLLVDGGEIPQGQQCQVDHARLFANLCRFRQCALGTIQIGTPAQ